MAAIALAVAPVADARAQLADSPEALLEAWQDALVQGDYEAYVACLHPATREVPEYGSEEAMAFWSGQMEELRRMGFAGRFAFETVTEGSARLPAGSVRALPVVEGEPSDESIVLIREAGRWTILRIFS